MENYCSFHSCGARPHPLSVPVKIFVASMVISVSLSSAEHLRSSGYRRPSNRLTTINLPAVYKRLDTTIHDDDEMFMSVNRSLMHYLHAGITALLNSHQAMVSAGSFCIDVWMCVPKPSSVLVLPCGSGRETRYFRAAYPDARLFVSDLNEKFSNWTASTFGGQAVRPSKDPAMAGRSLRGVNPQGYSLIWVGSLITHFPEHLTVRWVTELFESLEPGGVLVLTSAGARVHGFYSERAAHVPDVDPLEGELLRSYEANNSVYGFVSYRPPEKISDVADSRTWVGDEDWWGLSLINVRWFHEVLLGTLSASARIVYTAERAYADFQDVVAIHKSK